MKLKPKNYNLKATQGFTLIELLIVIAILTILFAITIIAVNPSRQFSQANDTQRRSDVLALLNALGQYAADNRGALPAFIPSSSTVMITGTATTGCAIDCAASANFPATTTIAACLPLGNALAPTYLASIPYDPLQANASSTYYVATRSTSGNRITISACGTEIASPIISVTR